MNILKLIAEKKRVIKDSRNKKADAEMFVQLDQIDTLRAEREREEKRHMVKEQLQQEKAQLRKLRHKKFKKVLSGIREGMKEMNQKVEEKQNEGKGIFAK